jgi:hypothetical protein
MPTFDIHQISVAITYPSDGWMLDIVSDLGDCLGQSFPQSISSGHGGPLDSGVSWSLKKHDHNICAGVWSHPRRVVMSFQKDPIEDRLDVGSCRLSSLVVRDGEVYPLVI